MVLIVVLANMLGAAISEQGKRIHSEDGYSIIPPVGWIPNKTEPCSQSFSHPTDPTYTGFSIKVMSIPSYRLEQYVRDLKERYQGYCDEFQVISEKCRAVNDLGGYEVVYTCRFHNETLKEIPSCLRGQTIKGKVLCLVDDYGHLYDIMYDTREETYDQHLPDFETSLETIEIKQRWMGIPVWVMETLLAGTGLAVIGGIFVWRQRRLRSIKDEANAR